MEKKNVSSLGDYSNKGSFGAAFKAAHKTGGNIHTFDYNGKMYTTQTADNTDSRTTPDNRSWLKHKVHQHGHTLNAMPKKIGLPGLDSDREVEALGYSQGKPWSKEVDYRRAEYHRREANKK